MRMRSLYGAFVDMAIVMGEIQECLFSVMAQQSSQQIRLQHVRRLASRLVDIRSAVKEVSFPLRYCLAALLTPLDPDKPQ